MSPLLTFTALRLGLFVLALVIFWGMGARDWLLLLLAAFTSMALSYLLLRGPRDRLAVSIQERIEGRAARRERQVTDEDVEDAAVEGRPVPEQGPDQDDTGEDRAHP